MAELARRIEQATSMLVVESKDVEHISHAIPATSENHLPIRH
jgi:hypothetical protein